MAKVWIDRAWFAGLFEADGTFVFGGRNKQRLYLSVEMTTEEIIDRCLNLFGGTKHGPYDKNHGHNILPIFMWRLSKQEEVWDLIEDIYPFLSKRRQEKINLAKIRRDSFIDLRKKTA